MREREILIELIQNAVDGCARNWAEVIADHLLANGVTIPPCKVGDTVYETDGVRVYESTITGVIYDTGHLAFSEDALGKTIFLTPEEAEAAELARQIAELPEREE